MSPASSPSTSWLRAEGDEDDGSVGGEVWPADRSESDIDAEDGGRTGLNEEKYCKHDAHGREEAEDASCSGGFDSVRLWPASWSGAVDPVRLLTSSVALTDAANEDDEVSDRDGR
jgi:hypothetical protein